jgi:glycosyltransferase involved in cell wall biosynthesis
VNALEISVIVPVWNAAAFVDDALASIRGQNVSDLELILIDDGSTDSFPDRAAEFTAPARYIRQCNEGPASARNRGLRVAQGKLVAFLDADDVWTPGHLSRLREALRTNPAAGIAQGRMQQFMVGKDGVEFRSGAYRMPYMGSCLFQRRVFDECGVFDESMRYGEDYDLMFRCWEHNVIKCEVDEVSLLYRQHSGNSDRNNRSHAHAIVIKKRLERMRAGSIASNHAFPVPFQRYIGEISEANRWSRWLA